MDVPVGCQHKKKHELKHGFPHFVCISTNIAA